MRKILLILMCIMLVGCQSTKDHKETSQTPSVKEDLVFKDWSYLSMSGDSNEEGYYFIKTEEKSTHLAYYDYATKQEIYLCNKPECQHNDSTCTAYLDDASAMSQLFVYKNHLYLVDNIGLTMNTLGESQALGSRIVQLDLNGQNRKDIYKLDDDYSFEGGDYIIGDDCLYIPVVRETEIEMGKNSFMQVTTEKYLYKINLENGEGQQVMDLKYKNMQGVEGRSIIMNISQYDEDPEKYLKDNNYAKYDQLMAKAKTNYEIYDIDTEQTKTITVNQNEIGTYYKNKIYTVTNKALYALDLETQKEEKILDLKYNGYISGIINDYIIVDQWDDQFIMTLKISIKDPKREELNHYLRTPKEPVQILAQTSNQLLVMYDREGQEEKTWAGTMQYETKKEHIGLISIEDYLNNQSQYKDIKTLTEKRLF